MATFDDAPNVPFDVPLQALLTTRINEYKALIQKFLQAMIGMVDGSLRTGAQAARPEDVLRQILDKDREVQAAVKALAEHQTMQQQLCVLENAVGRQDRAVADLATRLKKAETTLSTVLAQANKRLAVARQAQKAAIDPEELVNYAAHASYSVAPPPNWVQGMLAPFSGPYPDGGDMKASHLYLKMTTGFYTPLKVEPPQPVDAPIQPAAMGVVHHPHPTQPVSEQEDEVESIGFLSSDEDSQA